MSDRVVNASEGQPSVATRHDVQFGLPTPFLVIAAVAVFLAAWQVWGQAPGMLECVLFLLIAGVAIISTWLKWLPTWVLGFGFGTVAGLIAIPFPLGARVILSIVVMACFALGGQTRRFARDFPASRWRWCVGYVLCFLIAVCFTPSDIVTFLVVALPLAVNYAVMARLLARRPRALLVHGPLLILLGGGVPLGIFLSLTAWWPEQRNVSITWLVQGLPLMELAAMAGIPLALLGVTAVALGCLRGNTKSPAATADAPGRPASDPRESAVQPGADQPQAVSVEQDESSTPDSHHSSAPPAAGRATTAGEPPDEPVADDNPGKLG